MVQKHNSLGVIKHYLIIATWICLAIILGWCAISTYSVVDELIGAHPSDSEMIDNFQKHRVEFNQLLQMFIEDQHLETVAHQWISPKDFILAGITPQRLDEYNSLLWKINLRITFHRIALRPSASIRKAYDQTGLKAVEFIISIARTCSFGFR